MKSLVKKSCFNIKKKYTLRCLEYICSVSHR